MREKIKATKTFKKLEKFQQDLILKRPSVKKIEDACIQIRNIGFDTWKQENNPTQREINILTEIL